jgi:hypothetical protein
MLLGGVASFRPHIFGRTNVLSLGQSGRHLPVLNVSQFGAAHCRTALPIAITTVLAGY